MKKLLLGFMILSVMLLAACTALEDASYKFSTNEEVISFQALIAASLLPESNNEPLSSTSNLSGAQSLSAQTLEVSEEDTVLNHIDPYIELIEKILGSNQGLTVDVTTSDVEGYDSMMTFETSGIAGATQTYVIHYNLTLEDEEEDETEYTLEGIMMVGDQVYTVSGEREVEVDEEKIEFIAKLDDLNYVEVDYKIETDETEFEVKVVTNGEITSETEIEIEFDDAETKVELEYLTGINKGTYEFKYEFENDQPILKIQFDTEIDGIKTSGEIILLVLIDEVTGETYYEEFVENDEDSEEENNEDSLE